MHTRAGRSSGSRIVLRAAPSQWSDHQWRLGRVTRPVQRSSPLTAAGQRRIRTGLPDTRLVRSGPQDVGLLPDSTATSCGRSAQCTCASRSRQDVPESHRTSPESQSRGSDRGGQLVPRGTARRRTPGTAASSFPVTAPAVPDQTRAALSARLDRMGRSLDPRCVRRCSLAGHSRRWRSARCGVRVHGCSDAGAPLLFRGRQLWTGSAIPFAAVAANPRGEDGGTIRPSGWPLRDHVRPDDRPLGVLAVPSRSDHPGHDTVLSLLVSRSVTLGRPTYLGSTERRAACRTAPPRAKPCTASQVVRRPPLS